MSLPDDRKMFSPLRRGDAISPEAKLVAILKLHEAGATATALAAELVFSRPAVGSRAPVTKRVAELLEELERASSIERIPDGRYRAVRVRPGLTRGR